MKFIKCLRKHNCDDHIGVFIYATKTSNFYTVKDIVENKPELLGYKVQFINATYVINNSKQIPVVVYHLGL